ncbi:zinc finger BED domain-containing protein 1-like [Ctenocephalides felis]|uniref:zinc finger BED domain-containing protein 1-like n=1 Tax=Ctenocephalides felis TaxID=7515 RepID=UPI000E6E35A5|nr:zinc finger BED domain-containing protein 1-like [Ctenocephalides felis]
MKERQRKRKMQDTAEHATFSYKKIVVPVSMRSVYWKYFGFPADENGTILSKEYIVCSICQRQIRNNHNTTNLRIHLANRHNTLYTELLQTNSPSDLNKSDKKALTSDYPTDTKRTYTIETDMEGVIKVTNDLPVEDAKAVYSAYDRVGKMVTCKVDLPEIDDHMYAEQVDTLDEYYMQNPDNSPIDDHTLSEIITKFIVMDMHSPEIVNGSGFLLLIKTLQPSSEIPTVEKIEQQIIPSLYDDTKIGIIQRISEHRHYISLSIEEWLSCNEKNYVTFYINYVESSCLSIQTRALKTVCCPEDSDALYWSDVFDAVCSEFCLSIEKITAVVVGWCRGAIIQAVENKGISVIPCVIQTIQMCAETCFSHEGALDVIDKLCSRMCKFNNQDESYEDYRSVWLSTYTLLEKCLQKKSSLNIVHYLSEKEWQIVKDVVTVLAPLKTTIITLGETKLPTLSVMKPIMWQLTTSHLKAKNTDNAFVSRMKAKICKILNERYSEKALSSILTKAAFLDARFKLLPYAPAEELEEVHESIETYVKEKSRLRTCRSTSKDQRRISGMQLLLGEVCSNNSNDNDPESVASREFIMFQSETAVCLDQCPLEWWTHNENKYPNLYDLAMFYLCIPVCSISFDRMSWKKAIYYQNQRAALSSGILDQIIFINSNY